MHKNFSKLSFIFFIFLTSHVFSKDLHYAGFFLMSHQDVKKELPYSYEALYPPTNERYQKFSNYLQDNIGKLKNPYFEINHELGEINKGDALAFGVAITGENITSLKSSEGYETTFFLRFNILVFDFNDRVLLHRQVFDFAEAFDTPQKPEKKDFIDKFDSLYKDSKSKKYSFYSILKENISSIPENFQPLRIGINKVVIDPKIKLPKHLTADIFAIQSAQRFESQLSEHTGIPLIPYSIGSIKDRNLGLLSKFSDQADFFLKMPEPDIAFNLTIKPFKSVEKKVGEYRLRKSIVAKAKIELVEPYTNESYFNGNIHSIRTYKLNVDNKSEFGGENLWVMYTRLQNYLFNSFSKQLNSPDDKLKKITKDIDAPMLNKLLSEIKQ
ncbi:hypothetical protein N9S07_00905 [Nitrosomonadales bacterium]|jgi:hypothetical protein|nr:hypothetical protein [Nitrosomonadales bacterium]